jgi:hypothetical protein
LETPHTVAGPGSARAPASQRPAWNDRQTLARFNRALEREARPARLNEAFLEARVEALEGAGCAPGAIHGMTLARLIELTLLCAGGYADHGFLTGVGDLLFNPRLVLVHIRGREHPVRKERHTPLTAQFARTAKTRVGVVSWLRANTFLETVKKPLLPHLVEQFERNDPHPATYLDSVQERTARIVRLTSWLSAAGVPHRHELHLRAAALSEADREALEGRLCRFDRSRFDALGREIRRRLGSPEAPPCGRRAICPA